MSITALDVAVAHSSGSKSSGPGFFGPPVCPRRQELPAGRAQVGVEGAGRPGAVGHRDGEVPPRVPPREARTAPPAVCASLGGVG